MNNDKAAGAPSGAPAFRLSNKDVKYWEAFGFSGVTAEGAQITAIVPEGYVAFIAHGAPAIEAQRRKLQDIGVPPSLWSSTAKESKVAVFALSPKVTLSSLSTIGSDTVEVVGAGGRTPLPGGEWLKPEEIRADSLEDLSEIDDLDVYIAPAEPLVTKPDNSALHPLSKYSLLGQGPKIEAQSRLSKPIFGNALLLAQASIIYGTPNVGKTVVILYLVLEAVRLGQIDPAKTFYINADDSSQGVSEKLSFLDDAGVHTLVPGFEGFKPSALAEAITKMIATGSCDGVIIIIDTLKKFADLMDKRASASFGDLCRQFVMKGGTVIALAHTRKNPSLSGKPVYGGTSDFMEDFDAACLLVAAAERSPRGEKVVQFQFQKRRGPNVDEAYAYADDPALSYFERLNSVRLVDIDEMDKYAAADRQLSDADLINTTLDCIQSGYVQKMALVREVSRRSGVSRRIATQIVERYTGDDPNGHQWTFVVRDRGAKVFRVLTGEA